MLILLRFSGCKISDFIRANKTKTEIFLNLLAVNKKNRIFAAAFDAMKHMPKWRNR